MKTCSIDGCSGTYMARSFCVKHYRRWLRHGSPIGGSTEKGVLLKFIEDNKRYSGTNCLIWPYGRDRKGYGAMRKGRRMVRAHALMLEMTQGPAPSTKHETAHSCGNGHMGCVAPNHLSWKTVSENQMDRIVHGTDNRGEKHVNAKLTMDQVIRIIEMARCGATQKEIAEHYGISSPHVGKIISGKRCGWLDRTESAE